MKSAIINESKIREIRLIRPLSYDAYRPRYIASVSMNQLRVNVQSGTQWVGQNYRYFIPIVRAHCVNK